MMDLCKFVSFLEPYGCAIYLFICFSKPCFKTYIFEETTDGVLVTSRTFAYIVEPLITKRQGAKEVFDIKRTHYIEVIYYIFL